VPDSRKDRTIRQTESTVEVSPGENSVIPDSYTNCPSLGAGPSRFLAFNLLRPGVKPNVRLTDMRGEDMRGFFRYAALLAAVALLSPTDGVAQQPPGMVAAVAVAPNTVGWTARARDKPRMPTRPGVMVPAIVTPHEAPGNVSEKRPGKSESKKKDDVDIQTVVDDGAFLLPIWNRGFWGMPPGGLTRYLLPSRAIINIDEVPVQDPVIVNPA